MQLTSAAVWRSSSRSAWRSPAPSSRRLGIAELGHTARKDGRFGVVIELKKAAFAVNGHRITGHYRTSGPEIGDSTYTIDLECDAPIERQ